VLGERCVAIGCDHSKAARGLHARHANIVISKLSRSPQSRFQLPLVSTSITPCSSKWRLAFPLFRRNGARWSRDRRCRAHCAREYCTCAYKNLFIHVFNHAQVEEFFGKVAAWKHQSEEYEHYSLKLDMAAIAYRRWKRSVVLVDDDHIAEVQVPVATLGETETVKRLLGAIGTAFKDAEKTSEQFEPVPAKRADTIPVTRDDLAAKHRALVEMRRKGTGAWQKMRWVVHDKKVLSALVEKVSWSRH